MKTKINKNRLKEYLTFIVFLFSVIMYSQGYDGSVTVEKSVVKTESDADLIWGNCPDFMPNGCNIAILHGDPSKNNVDILFKVPTNYEIPNHKHTSAERMILLNGVLEVTYEGEKTQIMRAGSYAYGPANKPHTAKCIEGPCILFIAFEDPLDAFPMID